ncbi:MAG: oligosaccharide flippase family protein [Cellvibrionaceae bacterium]
MKALIQKLINPGESLRWRTIQGSALMVFTEGYTQGIRLAGNLIMTRLLYPEAFGIMLIVNLVMIALEQFSDAGVKPAVYLHSQGREEKYLNTAWVIMSCRGLLLTLIALVSAWPLSIIYGTPELFGVLIIASFSALITGFESPQQIINERDVKRFKIMLLDIIPPTIAIVTGIILLLFYPSLWVLAAISVIAATVKTALSFLLFPSINLRFKVDKDIFWEIMHFGKWILVATAVTYLAAEGDKFIVSGFLTIEQLGIFSIAITLAKLVEVISGKLSFLLLMPVYIEIDKQDDKLAARRKVKKIKLGFFALMAPLVIILSLFGSFIVELLYDERYQEAGWMLQVMALGGLFSMVSNGFNAFILSKADSYAYSKLNLYRLIVSVMILSAGGYWFGTVGIVYAIAIAPIASYFILSMHVRQYNIGQMKVDLMLFSAILALVFTVWYYYGWPGLSKY